MSLGFNTPPTVYVSNAPQVLTKLNPSAFTMDNKASCILDEGTLKQVLAPRKCCHIEDKSVKTEDTLVKKIYSISVFSTSPETVNAQASIVLYGEIHKQNFPFRINFSFNCKADSLHIKKLTLGELKFNTENIIYKSDKTNMGFQAIVNPQKFTPSIEHPFELHQRTYLNIILADSLTGEQIFISKKVTVGSLLPEKIKLASSKVLKNSPNIPEREMETSYPSFNPADIHTEGPNLKRPRLCYDKDVTPTAGLPGIDKPLPVNEKLVWSAINIEDSEEIIDQSESEIINLLFGTIPHS